MQVAQKISDVKVYPFLPRYLEIEPRYVNCTPDYLIMNPEKAIELVDENTIGLCAILGSTVSSWVMMVVVVYQSKCFCHH
jgi:glutamate decarboxylase